MDLMGARELLISWERTRMMRFHACRSSSRSARLRSDSDQELEGIAPPGAPRSCGAPSARAAGVGQLDGPGRHAVQGVVEAELLGGASHAPARRGWPRRRSPARFTMRSVASSSKAKMARSISSSTLRSVSVASTAPRRCSRSIASSWFTSMVGQGQGIVGARVVTRARMEKSPSRSAVSMLEGLEGAHHVLVERRR